MALPTDLPPRETQEATGGNPGGQAAEVVPSDEVTPAPPPRWIVADRFEAAFGSDDALRRALEHEALMLRMLVQVEGTSE